MASVLIPTQFRGLCAGASRLELPAATLGDLLRAIDAQCPGFYDRVVEDGSVRGELAIAIDGEAGRFPLYEPLRAAANVTIVPAIGGGTL